MSPALTRTNLVLEFSKIVPPFPSFGLASVERTFRTLYAPRVGCIGG
jgi:hypothetical protein